jgi:hypothetical protein
LWLVIALFTNHREIGVIAMVLETAVLFLYYSFVTIDSQYLSYLDVSVLRQVTSLFPPRNRFGLVWAALTLQHLVCPLHYWIVGGVAHHPEDVVIVVLATMVYVLWNHWCWKVQGLSPYPVQQILVNAGLYRYAVGLFFVVVIMVAVAIDSVL